MGSMEKMGPCGGNGGGGCDMDPHGVDRIVGVTIYHGHTIDSVTVIYQRNGLEQQTVKWGGEGGGASEIRLGTDEYFTSVTGHVGQYQGHTVVRSLTFVSNLRSFGPYGREEGMPFRLPATCGRIVGFHGRSGLYLDAFGTYVRADLLATKMLNMGRALLRGVRWIGLAGPQGIEGSKLVPQTRKGLTS